jgi:hypothetical protein
MGLVIPQAFYIPTQATEDFFETSNVQPNLAGAPAPAAARNLTERILALRSFDGLTPFVGTAAHANSGKHTYSIILTIVTSTNDCKLIEQPSKTRYERSR